MEVIYVASESKARLNLMLTPDLEKYISESAKKIGIARSAFVLMCVNQYRNSERNYDVMQMVPLLEKLAQSEHVEEVTKHAKD
jgi:hypothetical protein